MHNLCFKHPLIPTLLFPTVTLWHTAYSLGLMTLPSPPHVVLLHMLPSLPNVICDAWHYTNRFPCERPARGLKHIHTPRPNVKDQIKTFLSTSAVVWCAVDPYTYKKLCMPVRGWHLTFITLRAGQHQPRVYSTTIVAKEGIRAHAKWTIAERSYIYSKSIYTPRLIIYNNDWLCILVYV